MTWSMANIVGWRRLPAAVASPAVRAVRRRRIMVRTRVRLARLTSARCRDCAARFKTDFFFFLTLVACPCAIYCSFCVSLKLLTLNDAHAFVKRGEKVVSSFGTLADGSLRQPFSPGCPAGAGALGDRGLFSLPEFAGPRTPVQLAAVGVEKFR